MKKNILVVVAHPDDEILGAGGTLMHHIETGDDVYCLILGEGQMSRDGKSADDVTALRADSIAVAKMIGFKQIFFSNFPDNEFDSVSLLKITKEIEKYFLEIKPQIVYTHHEYDLNVDHRLTFQAVLTASRPCTNFYPSEILTFESLSSTEWQNKSHKAFSSNIYHDISPYLDKKIECLKLYKGEIREYPHPRSEEGIKILAQYRGLESGLKYAEAFCLIRRVDK